MGYPHYESEIDKTYNDLTESLRIVRDLITQQLACVAQLDEHQGTLNELVLILGEQENESIEETLKDEFLALITFIQNSMIGAHMGKVQCSAPLYSTVHYSFANKITI